MKARALQNVECLILNVEFKTQNSKLKNKGRRERLWG